MDSSPSPSLYCGEGGAFHGLLLASEDCNLRLPRWLFSECAHQYQDDILAVDEDPRSTS